MPNPYVNKVVQSNGTTLIDISDTTAVASDVASGKYFYLATGEKVEGTGSSEPVGPTYETIVPLQTINCKTAMSNGAYGGYITNYTEYTSEGQKYRVIFDGTEYTPLTAAYYGGTTNYLYIGDANVEASSSATLTYPFEVMLYGGQAFYLGVKGSGTHTLQVDKITSEGSGGGSGGGGDTASNPLKGKIATFTGDSICQGAGYAGGYAKIIGEDYDMVIQNIGVSDGTVVQWRDKFCISESIADMRSDADYVILEGGGNDADWGPQYIPVGTLSSGYNATLDTTTFAGAFETMLKSAIARFPNAKIGYIFPHKCIANFDSPNGAYRNMAISALEKWGIPYCDLNIAVPPLGYIDDLKSTYTRGDGIHPNEAGYRTFYAPKIAAFMQTMLTDKTLINKTVTANGTYLASDDDADGYSSVTVNVSGGGGGVITDGIVVTARDSNGFATAADFYGTVVQPKQFYNRNTGDGGWVNLSTINFKSGVDEIKQSGFYSCGKLTAVDLSSVKTIGSTAFQDCRALSLVTVPELTSLGQSAFLTCTSLQTFVAPKLMNCNVSRALRQCLALTTVQLGSVGYGVTSISNLFFEQDTQTGLTITIYTTGSYVNTALTNTRNGATNATIVIKASEATTYNGTSYAAGDTIVTSTP